jgi:Zn finger protein HypA/HybF involved in hydrogenase expression
VGVSFFCRFRPRVEWSRTCPRCRLRAVKVRTAQAYCRFWYCGAAGCGWAGWRPPVGTDCPKCGAGLIWSHSRLSVGCPECGLRVTAPPPGKVKV